MDINKVLYDAINCIRRLSIKHEESADLQVISFIINISLLLTHYFRSLFSSASLEKHNVIIIELLLIYICTKYALAGMFLTKTPEADLNFIRVRFAI